MSTEAKNYTVTIDGEEYHLISDEQQEHIVQAAAMVDQMMKELADAAPQSHKHKRAVLTALQCASTVIKAEQSLKKREQHEKEFVARTEQLISSV